MCQWGNNIPVRVKVAAHLSSTGQEKWREFGIDACIAPIVRALQEGGIDMLSSCCGHGKGPGRIDLADGRVLVIHENGASMSQYVRKCENCGAPVTRDGASRCDDCGPDEPLSAPPPASPVAEAGGRRDALAQLVEAVADEFDMDAISDKLGRAMDAAQVVLASPAPASPAPEST